MPTKEAYCFVWLDQERQLAYAFWGRANEPDLLWRLRFDTDTQVNDWLLTLTTYPHLHPERSFDTLWPGYGNQARQILRQVQRKLRLDGFKLLSSRDKKSISAGYKKRRPVYVVMPDGKKQFFFSISAAARATARDKSSISLAAADPRRLDVTYA